MGPKWCLDDVYLFLLLLYANQKAAAEDEAEEPTPVALDQIELALFALYLLSSR